MLEFRWRELLRQFRRWELPRKSTGQRGIGFGVRVGVVMAMWDVGIKLIRKLWK